MPEIDQTNLSWPKVPKGSSNRDVLCQPSLSPPSPFAVSGKNGSLFTSAQMAAAAAASNGDGGGLGDGGVDMGDGDGGLGGGRLDSVGSLGMGNMNLESQMYTSTSLMATGNTHHIFDSTPPIQVSGGRRKEVRQLSVRQGC